MAILRSKIMPAMAAALSGVALLAAFPITAQAGSSNKQTLLDCTLQVDSPHVSTGWKKVFEEELIIAKGTAVCKSAHKVYFQGKLAEYDDPNGSPVAIISTGGYIEQNAKPNKGLTWNIPQTKGGGFNCNPPHYYRSWGYFKVSGTSQEAMIFNTLTYPFQTGCTQEALTHTHTSDTKPQS